MVPKNKRNVSKQEYLNKAYIIYNAMIGFLIKDFGIKSVSRDLKTFTNNAKMSKEDAENFYIICNKYNVDVESSYPAWLMETYRNNIINLLNNFINAIIQANSIYPNSLAEFDVKRRYQWEAISYCYTIQTQFKFIIEYFHGTNKINVERYMPYIDMLAEEIVLLKRWKKSINKIKEYIIENNRKNEIIKNKNESKIEKQIVYIKDKDIIQPIKFVTKPVIFKNN